MNIFEKELQILEDDYLKRKQDLLSKAANYTETNVNDILPKWCGYHRIMNTPEITELELIHTDGWTSYEENAEIEIYQKGNQYFYREGANMVFADPDEPYWSELTEINEDQVISLIEEWEEYESDIC